MDWNAGIYHKVSEPQFEWGMAVLSRLTVEGSERVLDVGCGTGRLTRELARRVPRGRAIASDRSASMLEIAAPLLAEDRVPVVRADAARLPFAEAFDVVFSTATFHWVLDHDELFASIFRALRPGGRLHAQCGGGPNLERLRCRAAGLLSQPAFCPYFGDAWREPWEYADPATSRARLERVGFIDVHTSLESTPVAFANASEFRIFVDHVCLRPYLSCLPPSLHDAFSTAIVEQAAQDCPAFILDYVRLNLTARRPG